MKDALTKECPVVITPIVKSPYVQTDNFSSGVLPPPVGNFYTAPNGDIYTAPNGDPYGY